MSEQTPRKPSSPLGDTVTVSSTMSKMWHGIRRTWRLYKRSKMGLMGLGIVLAFVIMAVFAPLISPYSPDFRAPSSDIFIADYADLDLTNVRNWSTPIGLETAGTGHALKRIMVYSAEGDTVVFNVKPGLSDVTGGSGVVVEDDPLSPYTLPKNLTYINLVRFPTPYPEPGNLDISDSFFFLLQGNTLYEYRSNFANTTIQWTLPFEPEYISNLWNGYVPQTPRGRMALAFANETSVWLLDMRARMDGDNVIRDWTSNVTIPGAKIVSSPIVMDTIQFGGALAVPTDKGLYVYRLNVTNKTDPITQHDYADSVTIGKLLWSNDYNIARAGYPDDFVTPIDSPAAITFPIPTDATTSFGKTSILLATRDGRIVSFNTFNGTVLYANRIIMPAIPSYTITGIYPSASGVMVVGEASSSRGFVASLEPNFGRVQNNQTAYTSTEGQVNAAPTFVISTKEIIFSTDRGIIYIADELVDVYATFTAPSGGMATPVTYLGNIIIADSETGNYFATITKENTIFIETLQGVNVAPLAPGSYPSGNRYILGTDYEGHDILAWLIYGTRSELLVGVTAALFAVVIGTIVGLVAGYYSGFVDDLLMRATDVVLSLPFIVIALLFASVFGPLLINIVIIIAVLSWAGIARVIRSVTLSLKERSFVDAAIIAGASESRLIFRHIAPNVLPYTFLYMTFTVSGAIITEAILAFLGYGDPSNVTWGMMLQFLQISGHSLDAPWWLLPPGIAITLLSLSFYLIGRAFDEVVNPRLRRR
jgi:peptide/nickel transport system permease protein